MHKLFILFFLCTNLFAQPGEWEFKSFTKSDGINMSWNINSFVQDHDGYLWFADIAGLNKYDGYTFKTYLISGDSVSLGSFFVKTVLCDNKNRIWVLGLNGNFENPELSLSQYNQETDGFLNYYRKIDFDRLADLGKPFFLKELRDGLLCGSAGKGLFFFDISAGQFTEPKEYKFLIEKTRDEGIDLLAVHPDGNYWFGSQTDGVIKYNHDQKTIKRFKNEPGNQNSLISNSIKSLHIDTSGVIFIGTWNSGLHVLNPENDQITRLPAASGKYKAFSTTVSSGISYDGLGNVFINSRTQDGRYWVASNNGGLRVYDPSLSEFQQYNFDPTEPGGLVSELFYGFYEDNQNNVWLGTINRGIMKAVPSKTVFRPGGYGMPRLEQADIRGILSILESRNGELWIGSVEGFLLRYNPETRQSIEYRYDLNKQDKYSLPGFDLDAIFEDKDGLIWIGSNGGLIRHDPWNRTFEKVTLLAGDTSHSNFDVQTIIADNDENFLWIGTHGQGLFKVNKSTLEAEHFYEDSHVKNINLCLYKNDVGDLFVGKMRGLHVLRKSSETFQRVLPSVTCNSIYQDKNGNLWISSDVGLYKLDQSYNLIKIYTKADGLPTDAVGGIIEQDGLLWIATVSGMVRFDPQNETFQTYDSQDGAMEDYFCDGNNAYYRTKNGVMLFGGFYGITAFNPARIKQNMHPPIVHITDVTISDSENDSTITQNTAMRESISLGYNQNDITFNYVGIHLKKPERNKYQYMLAPYDNGWKDAGTIRSARYTSLDQGDYEFRVMAANSDGVWSEEAASLKITILPPWWKTWWAYTGYIILVMGFLYTARKFELNRQRKNSEIKESKLRAQAAEAQARVIQAENERKTKELEEARALQLSMLPKELPKLPHLDIAVYMQTATEVGGDYYDFHVSLDGTLTVVIGDATGHGMQAGTMVTTAKSLFKTHSANPDILFSFQEFSRCIREMNFGRLSMCMSMLKISDHTLQISSAAMPPAYIFRADSKEVEEYQFEAMPLGTLEKFPYQIKETSLNSGDTILLLSDGFPELKNNNEEMYGYTKIQNGLKDIAKRSPEEIINFFKNEGSGWINSADPDDDVTFVVIKVK
ncbi:MAG: SpoIIE family protein phosphatase [Calditrichaeota bacterium]|nr:SpoIIE family protein phosphatase [Calditrichota bacterium]